MDTTGIPKPHFSVSTKCRFHLGFSLEAGPHHVRCGEKRGDPAVWTEDLELRARVVKRTRGLGSPRSRLLCGDRGGIPAWDRLLPPCSLAEMAALTGAAEYTEEGDLAAIARLVYWKGSRPR